MTEFKKLTALVDAIRDDVEELGRTVDMSSSASDGDAANAESLHVIAERIREAVTSGTPRLLKLLLKARETDPNRQIYNEAMCEKIEKLFEVFCAAIHPLLYGHDADYCAQSASENTTEDGSPDTSVEGFSNALAENGAVLSLDSSALLERVDDLYDAAMLRKAQQEAWEARVATGLAEVVLFEAQERVVLAAEEKQCRTSLAEKKRQDKSAVMALLRVQEETKWNTERARRVSEHAAISNSARAVDIGAVSAFIASNIPDPGIRANFASIMRGLVQALLKTPEDINIRKLRSNNEQLIHDFGHPCAISNNPSLCICPRVVSTAEILWYMIGYEVQYTATGTPSLPFLLEKGLIKNITLPCQRLLSTHDYSRMGFEDYSERFFELREPDAVQKPDEWMKWYDMMHALEHELSKC